MDGHELRALRRRFRLTQAAVAEAAGMRQPDLSDIEHGHRGTPESISRVRAAIATLARPAVTLDEATRAEIRATLERAGASDIRVFGSVARGQDGPGSDLDLIARFPSGFDLFDLLEVEERIQAIVGVDVDLVSDDDRAPRALLAAKAEAVPL